MVILRRGSKMERTSGLMKMELVVDRIRGCKGGGTTSSSCDRGIR